MAYVARRRATASAAGLYEFLRGREQAQYEQWRDGHAKGHHTRPYPRQARHDAFAAGEPVDVSTGEIFGWGPREAAKEAGLPPMREPENHSGRAIVGPNDTVTFPIVDPDVEMALWLDEMDLR